MNAMKRILCLCALMVMAPPSFGAPPADMAKLRAAARQGDAYAQLNLGAAYDHGIGVKPDPAEALRWYRLAAEQGVAEAQFNLGHLLGSGGKAAESAHWLAQAADQGLADAQYLLGVLYAQGSGVERDGEKAVLWLRRAARQGHSDAAAYLKSSFSDQAP